ncbi:ABC transporter permease [Sporomusa sphaeroides]|uniref:ABC transporter permease n=1 Tax=Sporomusa sphaeroides TaxID=47679 RepID=UPI00315936E7
MRLAATCQRFWQTGGVLAKAQVKPAVAEKKGGEIVVNAYREKGWKILKRVIAIGFIVAIWQVLPSTGVIDPRSLPAFSAVIQGLLELILSGELLTHALASFQRSLMGFFVAVSLAIPLGIFMGWFKRVEKIVDPLMQICRNTVTLALYPVFILVFGLGEVSKIGIIFWGSIWPILINTIEGVKTVDPLLVKAARSMAMSRLGLFIHVILPAAVPSILTGLRISATRSLIILVAAEMLGASAGLGFLIFDAQHKYQPEKMYAGILVLMMLGMSVNYLIVTLESYLTRWKGTAETA